MPRRLTPAGCLWRLIDQMKFFAALLLPLLASAAILPEAIGPHQRTSISQPEPADRSICDEFGLKAVENGVFGAEKTKFSVTVWRLQDPTGALAAYQWQRAGAGKKDQITRVGNYLIAFQGYQPTPEELAALQKGLVNVDNSALPVLSSYLP